LGGGAKEDFPFKVLERFLGFGRVLGQRYQEANSNWLSFEKEAGDAKTGGRKKEMQSHPSWGLSRKRLFDP